MERHSRWGRDVMNMRLPLFEMRLGVRALTVVLLLVAFGCSKSESGDPFPKEADVSHDSSGETFPDFQEADVIQTSLSFFGWMSDSAILVEEVYTEDNQSFAEYYIFRPGDDGMEALDVDGSVMQAPGVVTSGIEVAPLHGMDPKEPFIELYLSYDSTELAVVEAGLDNVEPGDDLPEPVGGLVGIIWHTHPARTDTLWLDSIFVGPYLGEADVEYHLPEITYSEMSQSRRSLMVALWLNDYIEYFVFDLSRIGQ